MAPLHSARSIRRRAVLAAALFLGAAGTACGSSSGDGDDGGRTRVAADEAIVTQRPVGFFRRSEKVTGASKDFFGRLSSGRVSVTDTVTLPTATAAVYLLQIAKNTGWTTSGEHCSDNEYGFVGAKRIDGFVIGAEVLVLGTSRESSRTIRERS